MTEEEFKKVMTKTIIFIVMALIILIVIGIFVLNKSGRDLSIFSNQKEIDDYKKKVEEIHSKNIEEDNQKLEIVNDSVQNESIQDSQAQENIQAQENAQPQESEPVQETPAPENPAQ